MKKRILFLLICTFALIGIVKADTPVSDIVDAYSDYVVGKGEHISLNPQVAPDDATNKNIVFSAPDNSCVSVTSEGVVTATLQEGTCDVTVTATSEADNTKKHDYRIHVEDKLTLKSNGGTINCSFTVNNSYGTWYYESTAEGLIIRKEGSLSIIEAIDAQDNSCTLERENYYFAGLYTEAEGGELVDVYNTKLKDISEVYAHWATSPSPVTEIEISTGFIPESLHMVALHREAGEGKRHTIQLHIIPTPYYAANESVTWESLNPDIATVDAGGLVTAVANGDATIKVTTANTNKSATYTVRVTDSDFQFVLVPETKTIDVGEVVQYVVYQIGPKYVDTNTFEIEINDPSIANFVDLEAKDGRIKGLKAGKVTLTAKLSGETIATAELTVRGDGSHHSEDIKFMIKFEGGEGYDTSSSMADQPVYLNETTKINKNTFTKKGYVFAGWLVYIDKADGTRIAATLDGKQMTYKDGDDISKLNIPEGATLVLVAQWVTNPDTGAIVPIAIVSLALIGGYLYFVKSRKFNKIANI